MPQVQSKNISCHKKCSIQKPVAKMANGFFGFCRLFLSCTFPNNDAIKWFLIWRLSLVVNVCVLSNFNASVLNSNLFKLHVITGNLFQVRKIRSCLLQCMANRISFGKRISQAAYLWNLRWTHWCLIIWEYYRSSSMKTWRMFTLSFIVYLEFQHSLDTHICIVVILLL